MDIVLNYLLPFFGMLVALIVIHELGHYFTAKMFGIKVLEAGLGYPPRIWGFHWRETLYSINWIPLGGFVRLLGEEDPTDPQSLAAQSAWKRIIVLAAGSFMNILLPIILFTILFMLPRDVPAGPAVIDTVMPESPAAEAGLLSGDIVREIDGEFVRNTPELGRKIRLRQGEVIDFTVERNDPIDGEQVLQIPVQSRWNPKDTVHIVQSGETSSSIARDLGLQLGMVLVAADIEFQLEVGEQITVTTDGGPRTYTIREGDNVAVVARRLDVDREVVREAAGLPDPDIIESGTELRFTQGPTGITIGDLYGFTVSESLPIWEAVPKGWTSTWESLVLARNQVIAMVKGGSGLDVAGPVGIAQATGEVVEEAGWKPLLEFAALLSINLAIINILPLPMLDGGRIVFVLLEVARRGKRVAPEKEAIVHLIGLALMLTMAIVVTYFDVARIIAGGSLFE
ncbi:MAG: M50 family metallopeptidase [Dehalococcoidia bacterium]